MATNMSNGRKIGIPLNYLCIHIIKDGADIPLESPIVDEKRTFTFEKSKSGYFSLENKWVFMYI